MQLIVVKLWALSSSSVLSTFMSLQLHAVAACTSLRRWTQWILVSLRCWIQWSFLYSLLCLDIAKLWILSCIWILSLTSISAQLHALTASIFEMMNTMDACLFTQLNTVTFLWPFYFFFCVCVCLNIAKLWILSCIWILSLISVYTAACNVNQYIWRDEHNGHISLHSWILSLTFTSIQLHAMTAGIFEEMNTVDTYLFTQLNTVTFSLLYVFKHSQALNLLMQLSSVIDFYWLHAMTGGIFEEMNTVWTLISLHSWIQGPFYFFMCLNIARLWILSCSWILSLTFMSIQLHAMTAGIFEEMNTMDTSLYAVEYGALFIALCVMNTVNPYLFTLLNTMTLLCLTSLV